jgi:hypothetical protein
MKTVYQRAEAALEAAKRRCKNDEAQSRLEDVQLHCKGYAEPGYTDPASGVIALGNWNDISKWNEKKQSFDHVDSTLPRLADNFEKLGVELDWSDEWKACDECFKLVRTSPDSYGWQRHYWESENGIVCADCVKKDPGDYLDDLEGNTSSCVTFDLDLEEAGYKRVEMDFENGWYGGQSANPEAIGEALRKRGVTRFIFNLDSTGQFDMKFSVWVHEIEYDKVGKLDEKETEGEDPAEGLKRGLQAASAEMGKLQGDGIRYAKINADGTATTRIVSPQEFHDGIKS